MASPRMTTPDTANRPLGLSTRNASAIARSLSAERLMTQLEMTTSTELSGSGMFSISPFRNSTFVTPARRPFSRASASISSVMSSPNTFPVGPTRRADSSTSMPPPDPRSRTVSPSRRSISAVGLPHPSEASTASLGRISVSSTPYKSPLIGSPQPQAVAQQPPAAAPADTRLETLFKALADRTRLRILGLLAAGEVCVCDIHESLGLPQPTTSRHLAYLRKAGLVSGRKQGLWVHYRLADLPDPVVRTVLDAVS